jgi:hypothetical protein
VPFFFNRWGQACIRALLHPGYAKYAGMQASAAPPDPSGPLLELAMRWERGQLESIDFDQLIKAHSLARAEGHILGLASGVHIRDNCIALLRYMIVVEIAYARLFAYGRKIFESIVELAADWGVLRWLVIHGNWLGNI